MRSVAKGNKISFYSKNFNFYHLKDLIHSIKIRKT